MGIEEQIPNPAPVGPTIGNLDLGSLPAVVGTVTGEKTLRRLAGGEAVPCDAVEIRLDQVGVGTHDWPELCRLVGERVAPVLLTLRHENEGGAWAGSEDERLDLIRQALPVVQGVDTEIRQGGLAATSAAGASEDVVVIGSFHDFRRTPPLKELEAIVREGFAEGADLVKIACFIADQDDEDRLLHLLDAHGEGLLSVLGMGPRGEDTRVRFPCRGSRLTYGYLDRPAAPGQIHAGDLRGRLAAVHPAYAAATGLR